MMLIKRKNIRQLIFTLIVGIPLFLTSCTDSSSTNPNQASHDGKNLNVTLTVPGYLAAGLIKNLELQAKAILNDGVPFILNVNSDNTISGTLTNISPGNYQLKVIYFVNVASIDTNLAIYTTNVTVVNGQTTEVVISDAGLNRGMDDDVDGYTNLAEVRIGTNPHNSSDRPAGESPLFTLASGSVGEVSSNSFSSKFSLGEAINGVATSTNFSIISGSIESK
ncbi:MAG: thrombospondin type 3 repeat-containing protein [Thiohalomonadales bacterium]